MVNSALGIHPYSDFFLLLTVFQLWKSLAAQDQTQIRSVKRRATCFASSARLCQGDGRVAAGVVAAGSCLNPGAIFVMRRLRKIVGQYSRSALLAVFKPTRVP